MITRRLVTSTETKIMASSSADETKRGIYEKLVEKLGCTYASTLGINLNNLESEEIFKWFLASLLFRSRIADDIVRSTYKEFERAKVLSPAAILKTSWQDLVDILSRGGYVIYRFATAMTLAEASWKLNKNYAGDLNRLHFFARDERDLEKRLRQLGRGIRATTVKTFLGGLKSLWEKAGLPLLEPALLASRNLGLIPSTDERAGPEQLEAIREQNEASQWPGANFEAALARLGNNYCHRKRCFRCPLKTECQNPIQAG